MVGEDVHRVVAVDLVGVTVADHVDGQHAEVLGQRTDVAHVCLSVPTCAVQKDQRIAAAGLQDAGANTVDGVVLFGYSGAHHLAPDGRYIHHVTGSDCSVRKN